MNKEELLKKISDLRKEIREHYELVGKSLYLITLELDKYLEWLNDGLSKEGELEVPKPDAKV
jgi:hypothetical protein